MTFIHKWIQLVVLDQWWAGYLVQYKDPSWDLGKRKCYLKFTVRVVNKTWEGNWKRKEIQNSNIGPWASKIDNLLPAKWKLDFTTWQLCTGTQIRGCEGATVGWTPKYQSITFRDKISLGQVLIYDGEVHNVRVK